MFRKSHFLRLNCQLKLSHFVYKTNQDSKLESETTTLLVLTLESIGSLRITKKAMVKKLIFQGKLICIVLRVILVYMLLGLCFGNQTHPWTRFDEYNIILDSNHCFD